MNKISTLKSYFYRASFLPAYLLIFAFVSPFLFFSFKIKTLAWPDLTQVFFIFCMTVFQAGISTLLVLFFAILSTKGLLAFSTKKYYFLIETLILLPALIPPLILALSLVHLIATVNLFPFGLVTLIFSQVLTYTGLCTVAITRVLFKQASSLSEWAYVHQISSYQFFKTMVTSLLRKDIKILFVLVFTSIFTSLSLPLLLSSSSFFSLEFFIYENLKNPELWPQALSLILLQSFFVFLICWKVFSSHSYSEQKISVKKIYLLEQAGFIILPFIALFFCVGGLFVLLDLVAIKKLQIILPLILKATFYSIVLGLGVGFLTLCFLIGLCFSYQNKKARKFIASFTPPGVSFMGFAFLIMPFYTEGAVLLKWTVGLALLLFPWLYRFRGERALEKMNFQVQTAQFLGASRSCIFTDILWPANRAVFFLCAGLASFWAFGDFSYSLIVSSGHWSLSLLVYDLFSSYHLDQAVLLSWLLLIVSFLLLLFWTSLNFLFVSLNKIKLSRAYL